MRMQEVENFKNDRFEEMITNSVINNKQTMSSLEIAEITGKQHKDVMKAIRNMEEAWAKVNGRKFALVGYKDKKGEFRPCYELTKTECLYVATKFNDEARAKLVLRWEELERESREPRAVSREMSDVDILAKAVLISTKQVEMLTEQVAEMAPKAEYCDEVLDSVSCMTTTQVAKELEMSAIALNRFLCEQGIQYWQSGQYMLYADYARRGYAANRTYTWGEDEVHTRTSLVWTERGREFIHRLIKSLTPAPYSLTPSPSPKGEGGGYQET